MQQMSWQSLVVLAFKAPLVDMRLFFKSLALPVFLYGIFRLGVWLAPSQFFAWPGYSTAIGYADNLVWLLAASLFSWSWMNGLWRGTALRAEGDARLCLRFLGIFVAVGFVAGVAKGLLPEILLRLAPTDMATFEQYQTRQNLIFVAAAARFVMSLLVTCLLVRVLPWGPWIIDRRAVIGPRPIWHLTSGHGWRIFFILLLIWLPSFVTALGLFGIARLMPELAMGGGILFYAINTVVSVYLLAAENTAALLVYRDLTGGQENLDLF